MLALEPRPAPPQRPEPHEPFTSHVPFQDPNALSNSEWKRWLKEPRNEDREIRWWARLTEHQRHASMRDPASRARLRDAFRAYNMRRRVVDQRSGGRFPDMFQYLQNELRAAEQAAGRERPAPHPSQQGPRRQGQGEHSEGPPKRRPEHSA